MKKNYDNARELLQTMFGDTMDSNTELKIKDDILEEVVRKYQEQDEGLCISVFVKDTTIKDWLPKEHFSKIYYDEINYIKNIHGLPKGEKNLLLSMSPYLMWETNLLVDEESGNPLSQTELALKLDIHRSTISRNMIGLYEKKLILIINKDKKKYILINPYIMYSGKRIDKSIVSLFKNTGYVDRLTYESNSK